MLSRRVGEALVIGGGIRVVVLSADRKGVRLGITAPEATSILREELVQEVADANRRAAAPADDAAEWAARFPLRQSHQDGVGS